MALSCNTQTTGDVTLEVKEAFGDDLFLIDGIAALLFEDISREDLEKQVREAIELFCKN